MISTMKPLKLYKTVTFLIPLLILALSILPSCEKMDPVQKEPTKVVLNKKAAEILQADRQFAFELFKEVHSFNAGVNRLPVINGTTSNKNLIESKSMASGCL
jgi:hypothetical protein